jgi:sigma-54 dependent transcriptional regulator, acetoin dehydrogenase operon transcriptional activator AcoR
MTPLPNSPFFMSRPARLDLARQRFFEEGQAPTGVVGEVVFESWARCLRRHGSPHEQQATFEPVTASRTQLALLKNRLLHQAWLSEVPRMESVLSATSCAAMLADATGVLIGAACVGRAHEVLMPVATRVGVNLSEDAVGTTAPGVAARTGKAVCVQGGEHFFDSVKDMHCAAAPIRDVHGRVAGVLDISSERIPFGFDAAAVAGLFAGAIENRLLLAQSTEHLVIRFQVAPELLDSGLVGLVGIDVAGHCAWQNGVALSLLGSTHHQAVPAERTPQAVHAKRTPQAVHAKRTPQAVLGLPWAQLAALPATGAALLTLPNGLKVWARAEMQARDGLRGGVVAAPVVPVVQAALAVPTAAAVAVAAPDPEAPPQAVHVLPTHPETHPATHPDTPARLRESDLALIQKTLQACAGNVTVAAQQLGVSRGLIYRRLRAAGQLGKLPQA